MNFVTAHDGFTLADVVSYGAKHNEANGEDGRDGHSENYSDNLGIEGPTDEAETLLARARRVRAMLATLFLSQGTPMLLAGDELGHSQSGNNNAYAQDNRTTWLDWAAADVGLAAFVAKLTKLRRAHPVLRQSRFLHARPRAADGVADMFWLRPDGQPMANGDWHDPSLRTVCMEIRMASGTPPYGMSGDAVFAVFNAGGACDVTVPPSPAGRTWMCILDSAAPTTPDMCVYEAQVHVSEQSVVALCLTSSVETLGEEAPGSATVG